MTDKSKLSNDDDDEEGWITPDNIAKYQEKEQILNIKKDENVNIKVACMTTDYSMQVCYNKYIY